MYWLQRWVFCELVESFMQSADLLVKGLDLSAQSLEKMVELLFDFLLKRAVKRRGNLLSLLHQRETFGRCRDLQRLDLLLQWRSRRGLPG